MKTTAIIIAAGEGTRWHNYLGTPKHFIEIEGEKLLHRTVRLIRKYGSDVDIYVVGKNNKYKVEGSKLFIPKFNEKYHGEDKFLNSEKLWNKKGRTIVFYGDVWFSEEAMQKIMNFEGRAWTLFARFGPSQITLCPWGECFAQSFYPEDHEWHKNMLLHAVRLINQGILKDGGGWEHYCLMQGVDFFNRQPGDRLETIDDFTDDIDFPQDYERWIDRRREFKFKTTTPTRQLFTFCGVFRNEELMVRRVLDFAKYTCSGIKVVVQESDDKTFEICKQYTSDVYEHPSQSPEESKDFLMEKVTTPWTFWLDADEVPSIALIRFLDSFQPEVWDEYDAIEFPRVNYINGQIIEANDGVDRQFRLMKPSVRWNPEKQGRRIHIHPIVQNPKYVEYPIYHHRTLEKIKRQTERWNELDPSLKSVCDKYVSDVIKELEKHE